MPCALLLCQDAHRTMSIVCLAIGPSLLAHPPVSEAESKLILYPYYARQAAAYEFFRDREHAQHLELQPQALLNWTNADNFMGSVFVWTYGGRPEVIGCIGSQQKAAGECIVFHELHSLSLGLLQPAKFGDGKRVWKHSEGGVELRDFEAAPEPADSERE